jgi:hypothetical protein
MCIPLFLLQDAGGGAGVQDFRLDLSGKGF